MAYGILKCDNITFDNGGSDQNVTVSGLYRATTSGVTVSGTIVAATVSGVTIIGSTTVSGATVTGTTANFTSGNFSNIISSAATMSGALIMANQQQVRFREAVGNGVNHIALQAPAIVSADQTITLPDQTGTVITTGDNGSVSSTMLATNLTISAAAGSATTPSIAFTGDLNTGIYSPGADQLAVSTGGTGRLFIDSSGNVGIGTNTLVQKLSVFGTANDTINETTGICKFQDGGGNGLLFGTRASSPHQAYIQSAYVTNTSTAQYALLLNPLGGNVGIGTSSPGYRLDVQGGNARIYGDGSGSSLEIGNGAVGNQYAFIDLVGDTTYSDYGLRLIRDNTGANSNSILRHRGTGALNITAEDAGSVILATQNTERARIDSSGNVGIGTSSPGANLDVNGTIRSGNYHILDGSTSAAGVIGFSTSNGPSLEFWGSAAAGSGSLIAKTAGTERLRIESSGRVGIGTSAPGYALDVAAADTTASTGYAVRIRANATAGAGALQFTDSAATAQYGLLVFGANGVGTLQAEGASSRLVFGTNATERLRIDSSGRLLFNHTDSGSLPGINNTNQGLTFENVASNGVSVFISRDTTCLYLNRNSDGTLQDFRRSGTGVGTISVTTTSTAYTTSSDYRLKENVVPLVDAIDRVNDLQVHRFNFIADPSKTVDGFIAHEAQAVVPECVTGTKDAVDDDDNPIYQGIDQSKLVPLLTAALQEAIARIETLEAAVAALQSA